MAKDGISRRHFLYGSLLAGAIPAAGFGSVPSLKSLGFKSYNDRLNIAAIGAGGRGAQNIRGCASENIVALCDVDPNRAARTYSQYEKAAKYTDFRRMLDAEGDNIDAVIITTPDHMHTTCALWCMERGKAVYVDKPLTRTPWEARVLTEAAAKYEVPTQMGNQGYSHEANRVAAEIVWSGEIGNVTEVHASTRAPSWPQGLQKLPPEEKVPDNLDWDLWLGAAAMRPYRADIAPFNWRGYFDFGTGPLGDWGIHILGPVNLALQLEAPIAVEVLRQEGKNHWTFPNRSVLRYDFPARGNMPPVSIFWHDAIGNASDPYRPAGMENEIILPSTNNLEERGRIPPRRGGGRPGAAGGPQGGRRGGPQRGRRRRPPPQPGVLAGNGAVFVGDKGLMATTSRGEGVHLLPGEKWKNYELPPMLLQRSPGHYRDWIRACKGGQSACSNFSVSGPFAEWVTLGAIAYRVEGKLEYDARLRRFTNSTEANKYLRPIYRKGWEVKL